MFEKLVPSVYPKYRDGEHVCCTVKRDNPGSGLARAWVMFTRYDEDLKENVCALKIYASKLPSGKWIGYEKALQVIREEHLISDYQ